MLTGIKYSWLLHKFWKREGCATYASAAPAGLHCIYLLLCDVDCRRAGKSTCAMACEVPAGVLLIVGQAMAHNVEGYKS